MYIHSNNFFWHEDTSFHVHERAFQIQYGLRSELSVHDRVQWIKQLVAATDYSVIAKNFSDLAQKQKILRELILSQAAVSEETNLACLYYSLLMCVYYASYGKVHEAEECRELCEHIEQYYLVGAQPPVEQKTWQKQVSKDLYSLFTLPTRTTTIRQALTTINMQRLTIAFAQLTDVEIIKLLGLEKIFGMSKPAGQVDLVVVIFKAVGIGVFSVRFLLNLGLMLKHVYSDTQGQMTRSERLWEEFKARHWQMGNDLQWAIVSVVVNCPVIFHITELFAKQMLSFFLAFDTVWFLYAFMMESSVYQAQRLNYTGAERDALDHAWESKKHMYYFAFGGAACLAVGFTASLFFTGIPEILALCYFLGSLGAAMYHSCVAYGEYKKQEKIAPLSSTAINADYAWKISMIKNTFVPLVMMAAFMYSLPLALTILTIYAGWEYVSALPKAEIGVMAVCD